MQDYFVCRKFYKPESYSKNRDASWICYGSFQDYLSADKYYKDNRNLFPSHEQTTLVSALKTPEFIQIHLLKRSLNKLEHDTSMTNGTVFINRHI